MFKGRGKGKIRLKRMLVILMCAVMVAPMGLALPAWQAAGAEKDQYGFTKEVPSGFDPNDGENPYGQGKKAIGVKHETYIATQEEGSYKAYVYDSKSTANIKDKSAPQVSDKINEFPGSMSGMFTNVVAYDGNNTGRDSYTAEVEIRQTKSTSWVNVFRRNADSASDKKKTSFWLGDNDDADFYDSIQQHAYKSYSDITAGDFDGDGYDELAVYIPRRQGSFIYILDGKTLKKKREISLSRQAGEYWDLSKEYSVDENTARALLQCNMDAADIDRDGIDDLAVTVSWADVKEDGDSEDFNDRSSVFAWYKHASSNMTERWNLKTPKLKDPEKDDDSTYKTIFSMRTCGVTCADIDYDGFPEVVVAGYYNYYDEDENPGDKDRLRDTHFLTATFKYNYYAEDPDDRGIEGPDYQFLLFNEFTDVGFWNTVDDEQGPPALCGVAMNGRNAADSIFLAGSFYDYSASKGFSLVKTADIANNGDKAMGGKTLSNTWIDQAVAGNFDHNELGVEQVLFSVGYRQKSTQNFHYRVAYAGYTSEEKNGKVAVKRNDDGIEFVQSGTGTGADRMGKSFVEWTAKGDYPSIAIAAVDWDNDTDIFEYQSKEYTFSEPEVMGLLQAAPYFGDLDDAGYGYGDNCSTAIGQSITDGQSTVTTSSVSAGVMCSADFKVGVFKVATEVSFKHEWSWEDEESTEQTWSWEVANTGKSNKVVLIQTPVILYYYDVYSPNKNGQMEKHHMAIGIPQEPSMMAMTVDKYNELIKTDPSKTKDDLVTRAVERCVPGQPSSYPASKIGLKNCVTNPNYESSWALASNTDGSDGTTITTQSFEKGSGTSTSQSYTNELEGSVKLGFSLDSPAGGLEVLWGGSVGGSWGEGSTTSHMETVTKSGSVASPPDAQDQTFGFQWQLATWGDKVGPEGKERNIPVVGYIVKGGSVQEPLSIPRNVKIETVTKDSITVAWDQGYSKPDGYEVYQYIDDPVTGPEYAYIGSVDGDTTKFKHNGLRPETEYSYSIRAYQINNGKIRYSMYTSPVSATTLGDSEMPVITSQPKDQHVLIGEDATFSVTATPSENAVELYYTWQKKEKGSNNWVSAGSKASTLTVENADMDMDGTEYRVVVGELLAGGNSKVNAYSDSAFLYVGRSETETTMTALNTDSRDDNPYLNQNRGLAGVVNKERVPDGTEDVDKEIDVVIGDETYSFFVVENDLNDPEYIYNLKGTSEYYALKNLNADETAADEMIPLSQQKDHFSANVAGGIWGELAPSDLDYVESDTQAQITRGANTYKVYSFNGELKFKNTQTAGSSQWFEYVEQEDGSFNFEQITDGDVIAVLDGDDDSDGAEPYMVATETRVTTNYFVMKPQGEEYAGQDYTAYQKIPSDGKYYYKKTNQQQVTMEELPIVETGNDYVSPDGTISAQPGDTVQVTVDKYREENVVTPGDEVTFTVSVTATSAGAEKNGPVVFNIRNTNTGATSVVNATTNKAGQATATWAPDAPGVYEITAVYGGNDSTITSSGTAIYYALDREDPTQSEDMYVLSAGDAVYGDEVTLKLEKLTFDEDGNENRTDVTNQGTYQVAYTDFEGETHEVDMSNNKFTPVTAGEHFFAATIDGKMATCSAKVLKRPITLTAPSKDGLSAAENENKIPKIEDVEAAYTGDASKDAFVAADLDTLAIENVFNLKSTPKLTATSPAGTYETSLVYKTEDKHFSADAAEGIWKDLTPDDLAYVDSETQAQFTEDGKDYKAYAYNGRIIFINMTTINGLTVPTVYEYVEDASGEMVLQQITDENELEAMLKEGATTQLMVATEEIGGETYLKMKPEGDAYADNSFTAYQSLKSDGKYYYKDSSTTVAELELVGSGEDAVNQFQSKYNATLENGFFIVEAGVFNVDYEAGSNGKVRGYQGDNKRAFDSGAMILEGTEITVKAMPDENFKVDEWTVTDGAGNVLEEGTDYTVDGNDLLIDALSKNINVKVTFEPAAYELTFDAGENGSISGHYYKNGETGSIMTSPENVPNGKGFILTAEPNEGFVVKQWIITKNGEEKVYKVNDKVFTEENFILEKMDSDMNVQVEFEAEEFFNVSAKFVDEEGVAAPGGTIDITGLTEDGTAKKGSTITFTADLPDNIIIKEWRQINGSDTTVLQGSKDTYTINSVQEDIEIEIEVADFKKLNITYEAVTDDGGNVGDVIKATSEGAAIISGHDYTAYIPIDFETVDLPDKYQVEKWTISKNGGEEEILDEGWEATKTTLSSLDANSAVKLYLVARPTLTYTAGDNGTIVNTEGLNSGDYFYKWRVTDHAFVVTPDKGYEIDQITVNGDYEVVQGTAVGTSDVTVDVKAPEGGFTKNVVVNVTFKAIPSVDLNYLLHDIGNGVHGTIQADVERNSEEQYAVSQDPSSGNSLEKVYRDSIITITDVADQDFKISSWKIGDMEILGNAELPSYVSLGTTDNILIITVNDELIAAANGSALEVIGVNNMKGGILTYGAKDNLNGSVAATKEDGTEVKYATVFGDEEEITFTATPDENCVVTDWEVNGVSQEFDGDVFTYITNREEDIDVRAVFSERIPVPTWTLNYEGVSDVDAPFGSVTAEISKMPPDPGKQYISTADYQVGDLIASGKVLDENTGVTLTATPEQGFFVKGWYSDPDCTVELPGSQEELNTYEIAAITEDTNVYVKFEKLKEFTISVTKNGTGDGSFEVYVDETKLEDEDFVSLTDDTATFEVARGSDVKIVGIPAEKCYVGEWNGEEAESDSYEIKDVTGDAEVTVTFLPVLMIDIEFDLPEGYTEDDGTVMVGSGESQHEIKAVNTTIRDISGQDVEFTVKPHSGQMVDSWKVTYGDGTVEEGEALGIDNTITLSKLEQSATVSVTMRDIVAYRVPNGDYENYSVKDVAVDPDTLVGDDYENMVREGGTASFTVVPADGYGISEITDNNTNEEAGSNILTATENEDGSWNVKVENVMADIDLNVKVVNLYTVTIEQSKYGDVTVVDANGKAIESGDKVRADMEITATAAAKERCEFSFWNEPMTGADETSALTVSEDVTVSGTFVRIPITAKSTAKAKAAKITWSKVYGADRYVVYMNACSKAKLNKVVKKTGANTLAFTKKKLKKNKAYKFKVVAQEKVDGKYKNISTSLVGHVVTTKNKKFTNPKAINLKTPEANIGVGETFKIKASVSKVKLTKKLLAKGHAPKLRFKSSNKNVATVDANGVITANKIGNCTIFVQTVNGMWKTVKVTIR